MKLRYHHIILSGICLMALIAAPFLKYDSGDISYRAAEPVGIISLMQVDEFEGGSGSRADWLRARAVEFEKRNKGVFVEVTSGTLTQLQDAVASGRMPDMVSFSVGTGEIVYPALMPYEGGVYCRDALAAAGAAGSRQMAVPWCMGGYALIGYTDYLQKAGVGEDKKLSECVFQAAVELKLKGESVPLSSLSFGFSRYTDPLYALAKSVSSPALGERPYTLDTAKTQYAAYDAFVGGYSSSILLGTQRDLIRCSAKLEAGKLRPVRVEALGGFTDIVQYLGIAQTEDKAKYRYAVKFIEYLQSDAVQQKLTGIGMCSVTGESLYSENFMAELESKLNGRIEVANAFTPATAIERQRSEAHAALGGKGA